MGKKSLIKSTTKKQSETKTEKEKPTQKTAAKSTKKAPAKTAKKAPVKAKPKTTAKARKPATKSNAAAKKTTLKELTFLKFESLQPDLKKIPPAKPKAAAPTAPPLITAKDPKEAARLKALLARQFSMDEIMAAAKVPAAETAKAPGPAPKAAPKEAVAQKAAVKSAAAAKKLTVKELTFLKFESLQPDLKKIPPAKPKAAAPTAPPLITAKDPKEAARLKALLARQFSMDEIMAAAKAPAANEPDIAPQKSLEKAKIKPEPKIEKTPETVKAARPTPQPAEEKPYITVEPAKPSAPPADPVTRSVKIAAAAAALLILVLLAVSANNSSKYYLKPLDNGLEIWKGDFSPKDKSIFMVLPGVHISEPVQDVYSQKEVFPLIFNYYVNKSDALLDVNGLPDFDGIRRYLHQAEAYAVTSEMKTAVNERLNTIERMALLYKADVAISRNTEDSLESAIKTLKAASKLTATEAQSTEIAQKIAAAREAIAALKAKPTPPAEETEK